MPDLILAGCSSRAPDGAAGPALKGGREALQRANLPFVVADRAAGIETKVVLTEQSRSAPIRYVAVLTTLVAVVFLGIGLGNYLLNPLDYSEQYTRQVARVLDSGQNFANYDPNINIRALRSEQISVMKTTPDVVALGGSRWQEARADIVPGNRTFFNAHVHNDYAEDSLALVELLYEAGRLPRTMILSERFATFEPLSQRDSQDWLAWAPAYRRMAQRLGITQDPALQTLPTAQASGLFSASALFDRVRQVVVKKAAPQATSATQMKDLDIFAADGSLHFSNQSVAAFGGGFLKNNIEQQLTLLENTAPIVDPGMVSAMTKLILFLQSKGVQVVMALTPYQPDFYARVQGHPYARSLHQIEAVAESWSRQYGVPLIGDYDGAKLGCLPTQFRDILHPTTPCLAHVLSQLPQP
jgi:hypothetical protein